MHEANRRARLAVLLVLFATSLACASATPSSDGTPVAEIGVGRVLVAPLNLAIRTDPDLAGAMAPTYRALLEHFQRQDRPLAVIDARDAIHLWNEVVAERSEASEAEALRAAASRFAVRLAENERYGMLVFPALLVRRASVNGTQVRWDGVRHPLPKTGYTDDSIPPSGGMVALEGLRGSIAAGSLHLAIFSSNGALVHEGIGGLSVIQRADRVGTEGRRRWILAYREDAFADATRLREGVERAFTVPLPRTARAW
jgi:hypothetical protein